jgi:hypothetical protein
VKPFDDLLASGRRGEHRLNVLQLSGFGQMRAERPNVPNEPRAAAT